MIINKQIALLLFLLIMPILVKSQGIDSLQNILKEEKSTKRLAHLHYQLGKLYYATDVDSSIYHVQQAIEKANLSADIDLLVKSYHLMGFVYSIAENIELSFRYYDGARLFYKRLGDKKKEQLMLKYIGILSDQYDVFTLSERFFSKRLELVKEIDDWRLIAEVFGNLGRSFFKDKQYLKANEYFLESLSLYQKFGQDSDLIAQSDILIELGRVQLAFNAKHPSKRSFLDEAVAYFDQARLINDTDVFKARYYTNVGLAHLRNKHDDLAKESLFKSLHYKRKIGSKRLLGTTQSYLGIVYFRTGTLDSSFHYFTSALDNLTVPKSQLENGKDDDLKIIIHNKEVVHNAISFLDSLSSRDMTFSLPGDLRQQSDNYLESLEFAQKEFDKIEVSLLKEGLRSAEREAELKILMAIDQTNNFYFRIIGAIVIFVLIVLVMYYRKRFNDANFRDKIAEKYNIDLKE